MENDTIVVGPSGQRHTHTIILLHGRDSTASEFSEEFFESQASDGRTFLEVFPTVKWVFPGSKIRRSARFQIDMSQWFDIWSVEEPDTYVPMQCDGIRDSVRDILSLLRNEAALVSVDRLFLGGISQGGTTACQALLQGSVKLGGFIGMCTWMPFQNRNDTLARYMKGPKLITQIREILEPDKPSAPRNLTDLSSVPVQETPIFLSHSEDDDMVPIRNGRKCAKTFQESLGFVELQWKEYDEGGHWLNEPQGVDDLIAFLEEIMAARPCS